MKRNLPLIAFLLFAGFAGSLGAQESLTLERARSAALAASRTLRSALLAADSAELSVRLQSYEALPSLSATASAGLTYAASGAGEFSGSVGATLRQTVFDGRRTSLQRAVYAAAADMAGQEARAAYFDALDSADAAFFGTLEARAALEAARSDLEAYRTHLALARAQLGAGVITKFALLQTEAETAAKETAAIQAEGALAAAAKSLETLTGIRFSSVEEVDPDLYGDLMERASRYSADETAALIELVRSAADAGNPALLKARLAEGQARTGERLARADYLPTVEAVASGSVPLDSGGVSGSGSGSIGLSVSFPMDFWTVRTAAWAKRLAVETAGLDREETRSDLELRIQSAAYDLVSAARQAASAGKALEYAEGYHESVLALYRLSAASSSELSDAEALVGANRSALISARYGFLGSLSDLRSLGGFEDERLLLDRLP